MANHKCAECKFMYLFYDSSGRDIRICIFDQSLSYLEEIGYLEEDCELDDFGEMLWQRHHGGDEND